MNEMCITVTPAIEGLTDKILKSYPEACSRNSFDATMCAEWVGIYNIVFFKTPDYIPNFKDLVNYIEKKRNLDGDSFLYIPESIVYTPKGKQQQTYTIIGNKIFNKDKKEVFPEDASNAGVDRLKIFANLAVQQGRAVVVNYNQIINGKEVPVKYVVNNKDDIISVASGKKMEWGKENGNRNAILALAHEAFQRKNSTITASSNAAHVVASQSLTQQLIEHLKNIGIFVGSTEWMKNYLKENGYASIQQAIEETKEMQAIKERALADGTWMKASNGKKSNLNEHQWLQVRTKAFKEWFGDWENFVSLQKNLDKVDEAVSTNSWNKETLELFDNIINDIENGKIRYQRFPQAAARGFNQGGRIHEAASLLLRGSKGSGRKNTLTVSERYERDKREQPVQERIIESWAKASGIWYDNLDSIKGKEQISEGGEAKVFYNTGDRNVVKILSTEYFITPQFALDRITLHNMLSPAAPLKVTGFGRNSNGEFQMIVEQPFIQGEHATPEEIQEFAEKIGFEKSSKDRGNTYISKDKSIYLSDLHDENIIKTANGTLIIIDADIRLNTPELNRDGNYIIDNSLQSDVSKVVDENGEPKVMLRTDYAGKSIMGRGDGGSFFATDNLLVAGSYASEEADLYKGFVNLKTPFIVKGESHGFFFEYKGEKTTVQKAQPSLIQEGYDGVYFERTWDVGDYADVEPEDDYWASNVAMFNPNQFKSATDNIGTFDGSNPDIQMAISNYYIEIADKEETEVLRHNLFNKFKEKILHGCIGRTANYWYLCDYFGDSNYKIRAQIRINGNEKFLNALENELRGKTFRSAEGFNRWFEAFKSGKGKHYDGSSNATFRITSNENVGVALSKFQNGNISNTGTSDEQSTRDNVGTGVSSSTTEDWNSVLQSFSTPQGEIYAFATPEGKIGIDENVINPEHPIHEYTHLWDRAVAKHNPALWKRGVDLMNKLSLWKEIENNPNYGLQWKNANLSTEEYEFRVASEVHARLVGENGAKLLEDVAKEKGNEGIIAKLKQWILDMWKDLKATFSNWSQEEIDKLTLKDFNHMTVRDLAEALNPNTINNNDNRSNNNQINYGNDFRRVQEESRKRNPNTLGKGGISVSSRQRLGELLKRELESQSSLSSLGSRVLEHTNKKGEKVSFKIYENVSPQIFHDFFEIVRTYTENGELVDLHDDYSNCKCYLNEDGTCGFAIEPDGNLVSVFNLGVQKNFLSASSSYIIEQGATHLDAYNSDKQPLREIYEKVLGAKVASSMDYNMGFDHDNIAKNHGNPEVVFMVFGEIANKEVKEKHFNKDQYNEAEAYQHSFLPQNTVFEQFKRGINTLAGYYEGGGRVLSDDFPGIPKELDNKLNDHFMGGEELTIDDYRELWKYIEVVPNPDYEETKTFPYIAINKVKKSTQSFIDTSKAEFYSGDASGEKKKNAPRPKSASYESALHVVDSRTAQFNRTFTAQQLTDRSNMIASEFSDIVDNILYKEIKATQSLIDEKNPLKEEQVQYRKKLNILKDPVKGRQYVIESTGPRSIANSVLGRLKQYYESTTDAERRKRWENTIEFFEDLFNGYASNAVFDREGVRIDNFKVIKEDEGVEVDSENEIDDDTGKNANGNEGWGFETAFTNPVKTTASRVKHMLHDIKKVNGEKDDLGITRVEPFGKIYASMLYYISNNVESSDDFVQVSFDYQGEDIYGLPITKEVYPNGYPTFPVLEKMRKMYPWVPQVIERLTEDYVAPEFNTNIRFPSTGGSLASQCYTAFTLPHIPMGKIQKKEGDANIEEITPLNYDMGEKAQYDALKSNYNNRYIFNNNSVYDDNGKINKDNAKKLGTIASSLYFDIDHNDFEFIENAEHDKELEVTKSDIEEYHKFLENVSSLMRSFGININTEEVKSYLFAKKNGATLKGMLSDLEEIAKVLSSIEDSKIDSFDYILDTRDKYKRPLWKDFFKKRGLITGNNYMMSFYDSASKKTRYSHSNDNFFMKRLRGICMGTREQRRKFIDKYYGNIDWYKDQSTGEWRNAFLEFFYNDISTFTSLPYRSINNMTTYLPNGEVRVREYRKWLPQDIWEIQHRSYSPDKYRDSTTYYLAPIFADSPMSMTFLGPKLGMSELLYGYKDTSNNTWHSGAFIKLINQEMSRIKLVQERAKLIKDGKIEAIANFDTNGSKFCFMPELNTYTFEDGSKFLDKMVDLKNKKATAAEIEKHQVKAIKDIMAKRMAEYIQDNKEQYAEKTLSEEQYYNMTYAGVSIIQVLGVDLAYSKDFDDFQKRWKEVYAGGKKGNLNSKYASKVFKDGKQNVLLLADDIITSPSYTRIKKVINSNNNLSNADRERILNDFRNVNVTDAQAIRSMASYRAILDMYGKWDDRMDAALQHFKDGEWNIDDYNIVFPILKPFTYDVILKKDGVSGIIPVPQQHKDSEICALMMYSIITNDVGNSPVYKALSRIMEMQDANGDYLVHLCLYESGCKRGNQGVIDISFNPAKIISVLDEEYEDSIEGQEMKELIEKLNLFNAYTEDKNGKIHYLPNDKEHALLNFKGGKGIKGSIKEQLDEKLEKDEITQEEYNKTINYFRPTEDEIISIISQEAFLKDAETGNFSINPERIHRVDMNNYYEQVPTDPHHLDTNSVFGSQMRNIGPANLPENMQLSIEGIDTSVDKKKNKVTKVLNGRDAIIDFIYELFNENLLEDFYGKTNSSNEKIKEGLVDIFSSKAAFRDAVKKIVKGNPKYGNEFMEAFELDDAGDFMLSPNSPTLFHLVQEIVTSFFKNRITKQKINGAALIQAAGIGLDDDLRVVFDEKTGELVGAQCYMPVTSERLFAPLLKKKIINNKEEFVLDPEVLKKAGIEKALGYRIPTEEKSSMMPLIINGFTPIQNGSAIILPAEITTISGSDFDVDKMFIMLLSFGINNYNFKEAWKDFKKDDTFSKEGFEKYKADAFFKAMEEAGPDGISTEVLVELLDEQEKNYNTWVKEQFKKWFKGKEDQYLLDKPEVYKIEYDFNKIPKQNGRKARNNMLIQLYYNILTSAEGTKSFLNPQGFPDEERASYINRIISNEHLMKDFLAKYTGIIPSKEVLRKSILDYIKESNPNRYEKYEKNINSIDDDTLTISYYAFIKPIIVQNAISAILKADSNELKDFIKNHAIPESPIYPQAFAKLHARNMAGQLQLGIYAIQGSMSAKYQRAKILLKPKQQFSINGRTIKDVFAPEGGNRLKNNGQMIGASADNGKKPTLTDMGSTTKTAPIIGYMLGANLNHLEAALINNQPCMIAAGYSPYAFYVWGKNPLDTLPSEGLTTEMLMRGIISPGSLTKEEDSIIRGVCYRVLSQQAGIEYVNSVSRADSPNGSIENTYGKARVQEYKVDLLQGKMEEKDFPFERIQETLSNKAIDLTKGEDSVREQLKNQKMGLLHGMYALGIHSFRFLTSDFFFASRESFDKNIVQPILYNIPDKAMMDDMRARILDSLYECYITYVLSGSTLFGDETNPDGSVTTMEQKRAYYLDSFPHDFQRILSENEKVRDLLGSVLEVAEKFGKKRIVLQDVGSLDRPQIVEIQKRFEKLIDNDSDNQEDKEAREVALSLLLYSYYENGLRFTPDSFSKMFTPRFLAHIPVYNQTLKELDKDLDEHLNDEFLIQFVNTFPQVAVNMDKKIDEDDNVLYDGMIEINLNDHKFTKGFASIINPALSTNLKGEGYKVYQFISYRNDIYRLDAERFQATPNVAVYVRMPSYESSSRSPLFSMQRTGAQLAESFPAHINTKNSSDYDEYDDYGLFSDNSSFSDYYMFNTDYTDSYEEQYEKEGKETLRDPFCNVNV